MTITEALAEIKTVGKRIEKKQEFINGYVMRPENLRDPLEKDGGSRTAIDREMQAIGDLEQRLVTLRLAIQKANADTPVTVEGVTKSMAEWLVWRREVAPLRQRRLNGLRTGIVGARQNYVQKARQQGVEVKADDLVVNVDEQALAREAETLETVLAQLDGQLSLKNATILIAA